MMNDEKTHLTGKTPVERWILDPIQRFINNSTVSGLVLFSSALLALLLANSPWSDEFHHLWEHEFSIGYDGNIISKSLHHWINDGLMAVFFFVVGLELKREIVAGELNELKKALVPVFAAIGGMALPALIYLYFNISSETASGWGIPMATDIAFALGVLYLLGDRVPLSLKIFLTALAIVDDLGAVLVIAFFYTSDINFTSLATGGVFMAVLIISNLIGVRNTLFYGIVGIGGLWLAFLMSGVHATIAAVMAAMTIPAKVKVSEAEYTYGLKRLMTRFEAEKPNNKPTVTENQLLILDDIRQFSIAALTPLQRLEHSMHPLVSFIIIPLFALSNASVVLSAEALLQVVNPVFLGVFTGLLAGKVLGVFGITSVLIRLKWIQLPPGMNSRHLLGAGFLAAIGFTMSLFISNLAFEDPALVEQAKMGILFASLLASVIGYLIIRFSRRGPGQNSGQSPIS
ncbi:MAG TPA: Na+/H+ antiporter NhaA [Saprospiraceae bacterium]|nr:Na+/H+ antiporter NhaA [Saprospiraceae bacterium]